MDLKTLLDQETKHWKVDRSFIDRIISFERHFVNKREENVEFLGGVLLGRPRFRFFDADRDEFFDEYIELDDVLLRRKIHSLDEIDPNHKVSSDVFNIIGFYIVHRIEISQLSDRDKYQAQMAMLKILHYRFLSSLMAHYFQYEPDIRVAEAVYAQLNNRYALKRAGSWMKLIEMRCEDFLSEKSIHRRAIKDFEPFETPVGEPQKGSVKYMINDTQTRIKDIVKNLTEIFYQVRKSEIRVVTRDLYIDVEDQRLIRDLLRKESRYKRNAQQLIRDRNTFIRKELTDLIERLTQTMPSNRFHQALIYLTENVGHRGDKDIEPWVDRIITHAIEYLRENQSSLNNSIAYAQLLQRLRSAYMSSRSKNQILLEIRDTGNDLIARALNTRNKNVISSVRTGVALYIVLRTFVYEQYTQESMDYCA